MKYKALLYDMKNPDSIGQVEAGSIAMLLNMARWYASNLKECDGRVKIKDQRTGRVWIVNSLK